MQVTQHGTFLTQLTRFPRFFPVNCYLVREDDGLTLVDTAISGSGPAIIVAAQTQGAAIRRIVLTHAHGDHAGSLDRLHALLPEAEVFIGARDARFLAGDMRLDPGEPEDKLRGSYVRCTTTATTSLQPGDRICSLHVIAAPGHTPGHLAFLDTRDGTLIAGDAFQTRGGVAVAGTLRPLFPFPALATWHKPTALASARTLRALQPTRLATGHGRVLDSPLAAMDHAIEVATRARSESVPHGV